MKAALIIPARNKEKHVGAALNSALAQEYDGELLIAVSDQGSADKTREICKAILDDYKGPHETTLIDCPDRTAYGMAGLNAHFRFLHRAVDADVYLALGADDLTHPHRVAAVMAAFRDTGASYVGTHCNFVDPSGKEPDMATIAPEQTGFVDPLHLFSLRVGGSCTCAWRKDLFEEFPPIEDVIQDMWLPYFAACRDGMFVIAERFGTYLKHADANNTGLEGVLRSLTDPLERQAMDERMWADITRTLAKIFKVASGMPQEKWPEPCRHGLYSALIEHGLGWAASREQLQRMRSEVKEAA